MRREAVAPASSAISSPIASPARAPATRAEAVACFARFDGNACMLGRTFSQTAPTVGVATGDHPLRRTRGYACCGVKAATRSS